MKLTPHPRPLSPAGRGSRKAGGSDDFHAHHANRPAASPGRDAASEPWCWAGAAAAGAWAGPGREAGAGRQPRNRLDRRGLHGNASEALVEAVRRVQAQWAEQRPAPPSADLDRAFRELAPTMPEIPCGPKAARAPASGCAGTRSAARPTPPAGCRSWPSADRPPLAVLGGDTTGRALTLAQALQERRGRWAGADPLLLISTATADRYSAVESLNETLLTDPLPS